VVQLALPSRAAKHHHTQFQEAGPIFPDNMRKGAESSRQAGEQILLHKKERLDGPLPRRIITQEKIAVDELFAQAPLEHLIITKIFALVGKGGVANRTGNILD
jgi:hypothetical protein